MLFEDVEINDGMKKELDDFFTHSENGKGADFIIMQPENPNPYEPGDAIPTELTDEHALEVLRETNQQIWS